MSDGLDGAAQMEVRSGGENYCVNTLVLASHQSRNLATKAVLEVLGCR
jgi:hypothetical protein